MLAGMAYSEISYDVDDPVAVITLNRPHALNAWTPTMAAEFDDALLAASADPRVVGIVVTGAGRGFCAGADIGALAERGAGGPGSPPPHAGDATWGDDFRGVFTSILSVPKPVIAAINGAVAGMAVALVLACDLRFIDEDAKVTTSFAQRGLVAEWGTSWLLPRLVGGGHALDLLLSARVVSGVEAERLGLVNRCVANGTAVEVATDYVRSLAASCSPWSMATIKRQVYQQLHAGLGVAEQEATRLQEESFTRPDFREGVAAFRERRPPRFDRIGDDAGSA
jgi:enoyl-CoA hydratase/carnithine racemase